MATQSTSKQLVNYGATVVGGVALASAVGGIAKGIGAGAAAYNDVISKSAFSGVDGTAATIGSQASLAAGTAAADAASQSFTSTMTSTFTNPAFLTTVGLGVAGILLGSGSKRPSLALPNIMATAGVALSVGALLKQGQASLAAAETAANARSMGGAVVGGSTRPISPVNDPGLWVSSQRRLGSQLNLSYPVDLGDQYYIKLSVQKYQRVTSDMAKLPGNPHTVIKLPLPNNLVDAVKMIYSDLSLGMFGGPMLDAVSKGVDAYRGSSGSEFRRLGKFAGATGASMKEIFKDPNVVYAVGRRLLSNSTVGSAIDLIAGNTPNPHMAVTFQGVTLKKHTYTWRLSPTSEDESIMVRNIIRNLQAASLPGAPDKGLLLTFPDIVSVEMNPSELMMFRPCMVDSVVVNYTPNQMPAFFAGDVSSGHPVEMELSITLREVDIHTNNMEFYNTTREGQMVTQGTSDAPQLDQSDARYYAG